MKYDLNGRFLYWQVRIVCDMIYACGAIMKKKWPPSFLTEAKLLKLLSVRIAGPDVSGPVTGLGVVPIHVAAVPYNFICVVSRCHVCGVGGVKFCPLALIIMLSAACNDEDMCELTIAVH